VKDAAAAIEFYKKAFGAVEKKRHHGPDGRSIMYAMLMVGDTPVQLGDEFPMMEHWKSPESVGGTTVGMHIYVKDVDAAFQRAVEAGASVMFPLSDAFWGDRYGSVKDPFGHVWSMATRKKDLSDREIEEGAKAFFAGMAPHP
jgi:uncharacterized glyoxalase superfamily protein PhnB